MRHHVPVVVLFGSLGFGSPALAVQTTPLRSTDIERALDDFQHAVTSRWSYRHANNANFDSAIAVLRRKGANGMSVAQLGLELHRIIALGMDGHSGMAGYQLPAQRYLPFLLEPDGERTIAFTADRTSFVAPALPYLTQIDGRDVSAWCQAAEAIIPKGSLPYRRHRCLAALRNLDVVRGPLGLPDRDSVVITLTSRDRQTTATLVLPVAPAAPDYGKWPRSGSRVLPENIGYLRLQTMVEESSLEEIQRWMPRFRATRGLIIDVRDNTGGDRDALRLIYSYLAAPDDPPRVFTAAAYRLHQAHAEDHLAADHGMYRLDAPQWWQPERQSVAAFARTFRPRWILPAGQFSEWHYMVLSRLGDPEIYHFDRPTIVLMNGKSFSATDIFLAGLKGMQNVTLLGTPSAGGSAYTQEVVLGSTPLRLRIGSMVSFQADGRLFDGQGVQPDVVVAPAPEYYVGGADEALSEAVKRLTGRG